MPGPQPSPCPARHPVCEIPNQNGPRVPTEGLTVGGMETGKPPTRGLAPAFEEKLPLPQELLAPQGPRRGGHAGFWGWLLLTTQSRGTLQDQTAWPNCVCGGSTRNLTPKGSICKDAETHQTHLQFFR